MTRKSVLPQPLKLTESNSNSNNINFFESASPTPSPISPSGKFSTRSPFKFSSKKIQTQPQTTTQSEQPLNPETKSQQSISHSPHSQPAIYLSSFTLSSTDQEGYERRERPSRSSFFNNYKASRSLSRLQIDCGKKLLSSAGSMSKDAERTGFGSHNLSHKEHLPIDSSLSETALDFCSDSPPLSSSSNNSKKSKQKPFNLISRSHSLRDEQGTSEASSEISSESEKFQSQPEVIVAPAPVEQERSYRAMIASNVRQHSSERLPSFHRDRSKDRSKEYTIRTVKESSNSKSQIVTNIHKDINKNPGSLSATGGSNNFLLNLKSQATKGAGALSKGLFGKGTRGSSIEKPPEIDDENYELKVINLPLVQQTRLTRISKKLEDSRDKTEFWMPAFPWRAIDYLNYKGSNVEGLYRVPGSGPEIKKWRRRFDQELDINLFEQDDLYDINIIGSMLKAWLRELPDELLPKAAQDRIARECADSEKVPQLLIDELSNLSPFNYYLLFAITCHLSLLLAHSEKNKMDYRNLCICFQPCMKIDAICFRYLVCDWRDCWKGCKTEAYYIEQEYLLFDQAQNLRPPTGSRSNTTQEITHEDHERTISSSDSIRSTGVNEEHNKSQNHYNNQKGTHTHQSGRNQITTSIQTTGLEKKEKTNTQSGVLSSPHASPKTQITGNKKSNNTNASTPSAAGDKRAQYPKKAEEMRPLSPIKPLSPMGF